MQACIAADGSWRRCRAEESGCRRKQQGEVGCRPPPPPPCALSFLGRRCPARPIGRLPLPLDHLHGHISPNCSSPSSMQRLALAAAAARGLPLLQEAVPLAAAAQRAARCAAQRACAQQLHASVLAAADGSQQAPAEPLTAQLPRQAVRGDLLNATMRARNGGSLGRASCVGRRRSAAAAHRPAALPAPLLFYLCSSSTACCTAAGSEASWSWTCSS